MRLPAPRRNLKLNRQSNIRRTAVQVRMYRPGLLPCNFAPVSVDFPPPTPAFRNRSTREGPHRARPYTHRHTP
jgi:hypothetical protein